MTEEKPKQEHKIRILYEDETGKAVAKVLSFGDYYDDSIPYRTNMQNLVEEMMEDGGFWCDDETIIPFHRVRSIRAVKMPTKKKARRKRSKRKVAQSSEKEA